MNIVKIEQNIQDIVENLNCIKSSIKLAQFYDSDKMSNRVKKAQQELDIAIEKCFRDKPFENDEERLEYLFKMYEEMMGSEKI